MPSRRRSEDETSSTPASSSIRKAAHYEADVAAEDGLVTVAIRRSRAEVGKARAYRITLEGPTTEVR
jgi:hypothetical protein